MNPESEMSSGTDSMLYKDCDQTYEEIANDEPGEYRISLLQAFYLNRIMPEGYKIELEEILNAIVEEEPQPMLSKKRRTSIIQVI